MPRHALGPLVRVLRQAHGLTLDALRQKTGLSIGYLSHVENDERRPSPRVTDQLAEALGVKVRVLTGQLPAVRAVRQALGMSLTDLSRSLEIDDATLNLIEQGMYVPPIELVARIGQRLGVAPEMLNVLSATD